MPTIDKAAINAQRREYLKSLRKGSFITCDGGPVLAGQSMSFPKELIGSAAEPLTQLRAEADRKAAADRAWRDRCYKFYL